MSLFGTMWKSSNVPEVNLGIIGTGGAGKTYLLRAVQKLVLNTYLSSGLELGAIGGRNTTVLFTDVEESERKMPAAPLPSTIQAGDFRYALFEGAERVIDFIYHDAIGQLLTHVTGAQDHERSREKFVETIVQANVVWVLIPTQIAESGEPLGIHSREIQLTKGYLREALGRRRTGGPVAIAFILTKADLLGGTAQSALERMQYVSETIANAFTPLVVSSRNVSLAAIFPISSLGFGNVQLIDHESGPQFGLLADTEIQPWNVEKLLLWSLICGMTQQQQQQQGSNRYRDVAQRLATDLERAPGWVRPLKGIY